MSEWKKIGEVGVDTAMLLVTDPSYLKNQETYNLDEIVDRMLEEGSDGHIQLNYDKGHEGLGVVFKTGLGDGVYDVEAKITDEEVWGGRRIEEIRIKFLE